MELYPVIRDGVVVGYVSSSADFTAIFDRSGSIVKRILWFSRDYGAVIDKIMVGSSIVVPSSSYRIDFDQWFEYLPPLGFYTFSDLDKYIEFLEHVIGGLLRNRTVMISFSGGKDSYVSLLILSLLRKRVEFRLVAVYSHMPYLENNENSKMAEKICRDLDVEFIYVEPDKHVVKRYLENEGLPYRGIRWCTYLKTRPIRVLRKRLSVDYMVSGDRIGEALKRFTRLLPSALKREFVKGKELRPAYTLTILDVVRICRETGYIHPDYLVGLPRVSCSYCPYKSLYEFSVTKKTGFEDYLEDILRREYRVWYRDKGISWNDFVEKALWRYTPRAARAWNEAMNYVEKLVNRGELELVKASEVLDMFKSIWTERLPLIREHVKSFDDLIQILVMWRDRLYRDRVAQ